MGVWAFGPRPDRIDIPGMAEAMRPAVEMWMTAHLRFYDPQRQVASDFDAVADTGGSATPLLVFDTGANGALVQPIRSPTRVDIGGQATGVLGIKFQVKRSPVALPKGAMRGGLLVQVVDGGNAVISDTWRFGLLEAADSSLMWDHIYDATLVTGG